VPGDFLAFGPGEGEGGAGEEVLEVQIALPCTTSSTTSGCFAAT
jgi:hypothetical protein